MMVYEMELSCMTPADPNHMHLMVFSQGKQSRVLKCTTCGADLGPTGRCDQNPPYIRSTEQDINLDSGHDGPILLYCSRLVQTRLQLRGC